MTINAFNHFQTFFQCIYSINCIITIFMKLFTNERYTSRTECCLFKQSSSTFDKKRLTRDGLVGIQNSKSHFQSDGIKIKQPITNKTKLKSYLCQEKEKINLSKFTSKYSKKIQNDLSAVWQEKNKKEDGNKTILQFMKKQSQTHKRNPALNISFDKNINQNNKQKTSIKNNDFIQYNIKLPDSQFQIKAQHVVVKNISSDNQMQKLLTINLYSNQDDLSKRMSVHYNSPTNIPKDTMNPKISIKYSNSIKLFKNQQNSKNKPIKSHNKENQIKSNTYQISNAFNINIKGEQMLGLAIQTNRNLIQSQSKHDKKYNGKINNSEFNRQETKHSQSRLADTSNFDFGRKQLQTVRSYYESDLSADQKRQKAKQIHQSIILINFFKPSQERRKQIEQKLQNNNRNFSQYYF